MTETTGVGAWGPFVALTVMVLIASWKWLVVAAGMVGI